MRCSAGGTGNAGNPLESAIRQEGKKREKSGGAKGDERYTSVNNTELNLAFASLCEYYAHPLYHTTDTVEVYR